MLPQSDEIASFHGRHLFTSGLGLYQITPATGVYLAWPLESPIFRVSRMRRRVRRTMQKMEVGPPESTCRGRLQTAVCCCAQKAWQVGIEKVSASEPLITHRKDPDAVKTGGGKIPQDQPESDLFIAQVAAGVQAARVRYRLLHGT